MPIPFLLLKNNRMDTTRKIIDSIILELSGFVLSDENKIPDWHFFLDKLNHYRAVALRETTIMPESMYSDYPCLKVKCEGNTCMIDNVLVESPFKLYVTEFKPLVDNVRLPTIAYFGLDAYRLNFSRLSITAFLNYEAMEYKTNIPVYTIVGNKAIIKNIDKDIELLMMRALFKDPTSLCESGLDKPYPCPDDILARAIRLVKMDALHAMNITSNIIDNNSNQDHIRQQQPEQPQE